MLISMISMPLAPLRQVLEGMFLEALDAEGISEEDKAFLQRMCLDYILAGSYW